MEEINLQNKEKRMAWLDILNIIACICVIGIHCNSSFNTFENSTRWALSPFLNACYYWANGIFIMITGTTLLNYRGRYSTKTFYIKRIKRVFVPFFVWSLIALMIQTLAGTIQWSGNILRQGIDLFVNNGCMYSGVYWFFYMILAIYLGIPFISLIPAEKRRIGFGYAFWLAFLSFSFLPYMLQFIGISWNNNASFPFATGFSLYVFLGYWLSHYELSERNKRLVFLAGGVGFFLLWVGTTWCSYKHNTLWAGFCGWYGFPAVALCATVFLFAKTHFQKLNECVQKRLKTLSSASLGIYLIHNFFVHWIPLWFNVDIKKPLWIIAAPICIYFLSLCIVLSLKKIPILKYIVP